MAGLRKSSLDMNETIKTRPRALSFQRPNHYAEYGGNVDPAAILHNPHFNKGTAFLPHERVSLGLRGLLPHCVENIDLQVRRAYAQFKVFDSPMSKYIYLTSLRERNDTLFYHLVIKHMEECMPFIYTPTVGQACQEFGLQFRQAEGMYFCKDDRGHMRDMLDNWRPNSKAEVAIVCVTDGSRILGLGDLGACGMAIPLGKLSLYVAAGGFHPAAILPVVLDTGTNNEQLLKDEFYLGSRHKRLSDEEYYPLVEEFMMAVKERWPSALLQFEDFSNNHCFELLQQYRNRMLCFNDDIQGTGVTIAAGFINALKVIERDNTEAVKELRFVFSGAGAAGTGVADQIRAVLMRLYKISESDTYKMFYLMDSKGLVTAHRGDFEKLPSFKRPYARDDIKESYTSILGLVEFVKPHALIGLSGTPGQFDEAVIRKMGEINKRPIIFPLSNPTSQSECTFEAAVKFTEGRVVFASGSPFPDYEMNGTKYVASQGNNLYAFPGIGLGAWLGKANSVTNGMLEAATIALANSVTESELKKGRLYPALPKVRMVSAVIATDVILQARKENIANSRDLPYDRKEDLFLHVTRSMYAPAYLES